MSLARLAFLVAIVSANSFLAFSQTPLDKSFNKPTAPETPSESSSLRPAADEIFELSIDERRITRSSFAAATAIDTDGEPRGVKVRIGVSLAAGSIDVLLRNVRGNVRFRGTLDRILEIIARQPSSLDEVR